MAYTPRPVRAFHTGYDKIHPVWMPGLLVASGVSKDVTGREYVQKHIVTVEDEPAIVDLLSYVLDAPQVLLTTCTDGAEGLAAIRDQVPDLVIMDLMLPVLNGWQVYDALREDEATRNLPVIILSVAGDESERREAFRGSEVDFFMNKPFDPRALRRIVQEILDIKIDAW